MIILEKKKKKKKYIKFVGNPEKEISIFNHMLGSDCSSNNVVNSSSETSTAMGEALFESKADQDNFIQKYGQDTYNLFLKSKDRLKNHNYSTDITYWVSKDTNNELPNILDSLQYAKAQGNKDQTVSTSGWKPRGSYKYIGQLNNLDIYKVNDYIASMDLGINTGWCTTGRYTHYGDPTFVPSEEAAKDHFEDYTSRGIKFYYLIDPKTHYGKYAFAIYPERLEDVDRVVEQPTNSIFVHATNFEIYNDKDNIDYSILSMLDINKLKELLDEELYIYSENLVSHPYLNITEDGELISFKEGMTETNVIIPEGVVLVKQAAFFRANIESVDFSNSSVVALEDNVFDSCFQLKKAVLSNSIKTMGTGVFDWCEKLEEVVWPEDLTFIPRQTFRGCKALKKFNIPAKVTYIDYEAFCGSGIEEVKSDNLYILEESAFSGCFNLKNVIINNNLDSIGNYAFYKCDNLISVQLPKSLGIIGSGAFRSCSKLRSINLDNVKNIGIEAFAECKSLTYINLENLNYIGNRAFRDCDNLNDVTITKDNTYIGASIQIYKKDIKINIIEA